MSGQAQLGEFATEPEPRVEAVDGTPYRNGAQPSPTSVEDAETIEDPGVCQGCGGHVTRRFRRVFGDNDDVVHACPSCATFSAIQEGAGSR